MASAARPNRIEPHSSGTSFLFDPALPNTGDSLPMPRNTNYTAEDRPYDIREMCLALSSRPHLATPSNGASSVAIATRA
ncbi:hypothetical protein E2C01_077333 [Portunus trituberculatus]|uniref:Uncharacterized protein n=1 Tax=Portunus trituberculatus TaxID=210409 RepID=A0A5B7IM02_PORTR|nr:hypothetical protein [Portunus trituberculatus]